MNLPTTSDFYRIVIEETPLIDVRAPVEYEKGAFPTAVNLPLLDDEERRLVGIRYREEGNTEAVRLGHELVSGAIKEKRVAAWASQLEVRPDTMLYCFRGGQRSKISQEWIAEATGRAVPRLEGGYKAFRNYLISLLEPAALTSRPLILGGRTGTGKTLLLRQLNNAIDLEAIANHRGSAFGRFTTPQPSPINFENRLAWALTRHHAAGHRHLILEDEGKNIGDCYLPHPLAEHFGRADLVVLERPMEERVQSTFEEYVTAALEEYRRACGEEDGPVQWYRTMQGSLDRIRRRLGGLRHQQISGLLQSAYESGKPERHTAWIERLLSEYYDPMYDYQIRNKTSQIVFRGHADAVLEYLQSLDQAS